VWNGRRTGYGRRVYCGYPVYGWHRLLISQALGWLDEVKSYIKANPSVKGFPKDDKQVFEI
jgi:hypothetical protein